MSTLIEIPFLSRIVKTLSQAPSAEEIMALGTTDAEEERLAMLKLQLEDGSLTQQDLEVQGYLLAEHLVRMAKIEAYRRLRA